MHGTRVTGLSGLPPLAPESEWVVAALRARYRPEAIELVRERSAEVHWPLAIETARRNGVVQLIEPVIRDLYPDVPEAVSEAFREETTEIATSNLGLTGELLRLLELLQEAGIRVLPYKGPVLAQVAYGDIGMRRFVDLDILVRRRDFQRTICVLSSDGYRS